MTVNFLVVSSSLNPASRSRILAKTACEKLQGKATVDFMDLVDHDLPMCDGNAVYGMEVVKKVAARVAKAQAIILATPVYNFAANASAKNLIELTGGAWEDKTVGFLCAAGGKSSYMSIMGLANSLMLDFRCLIVPRFVYTDGMAFADGELVDPEIEKRVTELVDDMLKLHARKP
jgi:NAD(P)H-dependent FMN reductase